MLNLQNIAAPLLYKKSKLKSNMLTLKAIWKFFTFQRLRFNRKTDSISFQIEK